MSYEIRFLNPDGATVLLYFTQCVSDRDALDRVTRIKDIQYDRFEVWDGARKVDEGARPAKA
jgi:hypothetical protein